MVDLGAARNLGAILDTCWRLYRSHFVVFATIALAVVVPLDFIGYGLIEGHLTGGFDSDSIGGGFSTGIIQTLVTVPLITGAQVAAVMRIGEGEQPSAGESLTRTSAVFPALIGTVILSSLGVVLGTIALILPGIYLGIRWWVAVQSVVAEGNSPGEALSRSGTLVKGQWWRVLGIVIVISLIGGIGAAVVGVPIGAVAAAVDSGPLLMVGTMAADTVVLSFTALAGTLLYFDLRARARGVSPQRQDWPPAPPAGPPERPIV